MKGRGVVAALLALAPGLAGLAFSTEGGVALLAALAADVALAIVVTRALPPAPASSSRPREAADLAAWVVGTVALAGVTLLASPFPYGLGTPTPGRRAVLVLGALAAAVCVAVVLAPSREDPRESR